MIRELEYNVGDPGVSQNVYALIDEDCSEGVMLVGKSFYIVDSDALESAAQNAASGGDPGAPDDGGKDFYADLIAKLQQQRG